MSNATINALSLIAFPVLNASLISKGLPPEKTKADAITTVASLVEQNKITLDEVRASAPNNVSRLATSSSALPDDVRSQVVSASADVNKAIA